MPTPASEQRQHERRARRRREAGRRARVAIARLEVELAALELKKKVDRARHRDRARASARRSSRSSCSASCSRRSPPALATFLVDLARAADRDARALRRSPRLLGVLARRPDQEGHAADARAGDPRGEADDGGDEALMATPNGRTPEQVRSEIEAEREQLARRGRASARRARRGDEHHRQAAVEAAGRRRRRRLGRASCSPAASARRCATSRVAAARATRSSASAAGRSSTAIERRRGTSRQPERLSRARVARRRQARRLSSSWPTTAWASRSEVAYSALLAFFPAVAFFLGLLGVLAPLRPGAVVPRAGRAAGRDPLHRRPAEGLEAAARASTALVRRRRRRRLGRERRDGLGDQGGQPRVRPDGDAAVLEDAADGDRARARSTGVTLDRARPC